MKINDIVGAYTHEDGSPDSVNDLTTSSRCFAVALGHLLREGEGICVELAYQPKYPTDVHGKFVVYRADECIRIQDATLVESSEELDNGRMIWFHATDEDSE